MKLLSGIEYQWVKKIVKVQNNNDNNYSRTDMGKIFDLTTFFALGDLIHCNLNLVIPMYEGH